MIKIENVSLQLSSKLGDRLQKTEEEKLVLNYGLFVILHTTIAILATAFVGLITNTLLEIMIISIVSAVLKRYSGGVHASSPERCTIIGLLLSYMLSRVCVYLSDKLTFDILVIVSILVLVISYTVLYKKCPVASKNKPFKNESNRKKLRKKAFKLMNIYTVLIFTLLYLSKIIYNIFINKIIICVLLGISLQLFVLMKIGKKTIDFLDGILKLKVNKGNNN